MNPYCYTHTIFDLGIKIYGEKASSTNVAGKTGYLPAENLNLIHVFYPVQVSTQRALRALI
jgi:hypothetical protein